MLKILQITLQPNGARVNNKDISFTGLDDFSTITALTLDMSNAGAVHLMIVLLFYKFKS